MSDLTGKLINSTYKKLLQIETSGNEGADGTLRKIQTGDGTSIALKIATSAVEVSGNLGVTNNASVAGDLQVTNKVCASAFYGDGSNLTGVTMSVGGNISVGNATVGGNLYVSGTTTVVGATHLQSSLSIAANTSIGGNLNVLGTATVSGETGFLGAVRVSGNTTIGGTLSVNGAVNLASTLTVAGKAEFDDDVCPVLHPIG